MFYDSLIMQHLQFVIFLLKIFYEENAHIALCKIVTH